MVEDVVDPVDAEVLALNEGESQKLESLQKKFKEQVGMIRLTT